MAEGLKLGYAYAGLLFGALIAVTALAYHAFAAPAVPCFWVAYVLTRPFGAACGDLLSQPGENGGLGLGTTGTSAVFLAVIVALVSYLSIMQQRAPAGKP